MKRDIKFNSFYSSSNYTKNLEKLFADYELFRQKHFSNACIQLLKEDYPDAEILLTHSATGALEIIALTIDIQEGDEVILPSYTFVSTANAFALRGAKLVFIDIEMDTLGIDPELVAAAITEKTKAIVCVHYAGHACKIEALRKIADDHQLMLIEDAAMAFGSKHKGQALGTFGDFGVVSFDVTKHISASQGGLLILNNKHYSLEINNSYHTGANRASFEKGAVPYYEWVSLGSKYQMPETNAVILFEQLRESKAILSQLLELSKHYHKLLQPLERGDTFVLMNKNNLEKNYHEFYLILPTKHQRIALAEHLKASGIEALFHYVPLHDSSFAQRKFQSPALSNTSKISNTLLRIPLHTKMTIEDVKYICIEILKFFKA